MCGAGDEPVTGLSGRCSNRVVAWGLLDYNPAKRGVPNPLRHYPEKRPFESWAQIEAVANGLSAVYGPMVVFAAATGRRPSELFALEDQDVDRTGGVVFVRRAFANGRVKHTKTAASRRAVPLQAVALEALDRLPSSEGSAPVLERAGRPHRLLVVRPLRSAGVSVFRGLSIHGLQHRDDRSPLRPSRPRRSGARRLAARCASDRVRGGRWVDAAATSPAALVCSHLTRSRATAGDAVDARWTARRVPGLALHAETCSFAATSRSPLTDSNR